jgi:FtsH-binding integral membrane protein
MALDLLDLGARPVISIPQTMESLNPYAVGKVSSAAAETRTEFVRKTYTHLAGAIGAFIVLEWLLISLIPASTIFGVLNASRYSWLIVLGAFMGGLLARQ